MSLSETWWPASSPPWSLDPFDLDGPSFLWLYAALMVVTVLVSWLWRDMVRTSDRRPDLRDLGDIGLAYLVGGADRAADTLYLALAARGAASIASRTIVAADETVAWPAALEAYRSVLVGEQSRRSFKTRFENSQALADMVERLQTRRIVLPPDRRHRLVWATVGPGALLLTFGLVELQVGPARDKPGAILLAMMASVLVSIVAALWRERYLTREARDCLAALRAARARALRAPTTEELPFAFAMLGIVALEGTAHADYARLLRAEGGVTGVDGR